MQDGGFAAHERMFASGTDKKQPRRRDPVNHGPRRPVSGCEWIEEGTDVGGEDLAYNSGGLRSGAGGLQGVADVADAASAALAAAALDPTMFGRTPAAPVFASAVEAARAAQARGFRQEATRSAGLAERSGSTAALGDDLTGQTTVIARGATP